MWSGLELVNAQERESWIDWTAIFSGASVDDSADKVEELSYLAPVFWLQNNGTHIVLRVEN